VDRPVVRPASAEDIARFSDMANKPSILAWVAETSDGRLIAIGGVFLKWGRWYGFVDVRDEMRPHKMILMRAAIRFLNEMRRAGIRYIYAEVAAGEPGAGAWLDSLGFELDERSQHYLRWSGKHHD
jgi:hypothetical protein